MNYLKEVCTTYSIIVVIDSWHDSFIWKYCVFYRSTFNWKMIDSKILPIFFFFFLSHNTFWDTDCLQVLMLILEGSRNEKWYPSFSTKKGFCFSDNFFMKTCKISSDRHIKICQSDKGNAILKIPSTVF